MDPLNLPLSPDEKISDARQARLELTFFHGIAAKSRRREIWPEVEIRCAHALAVLAVSDTRGRTSRLFRALEHLELALISDRSELTDRAEALFLRARIENMLKRHTDAMTSLTEALECDLPKKFRIFTDASLANLRSMKSFEETFEAMKRLLEQ